MSDPYSGISRSIDKVAASVDKLKRSGDASRKTSERASKREMVNVDLLTSDEIEELRSLIENAGELDDFSSSRIESGGQRTLGMYQELSELGLCALDMGGRVVHLSPMAYWAVEKADQRDRDRKRDESDRRSFERSIAIITGFIGFFSAIVGAIVGAFVTATLS